MDVNQPRLVKISKPPQGSMEYGVDVYTNVTLPPSGAGWETKLEDLRANAVPTERLENGDKWVQAFIDMKEGRKPNQGNRQSQEAPVEMGSSTMANPYAQQQQQSTYTQQPNMFAAQQQPSVTMPTGMQQQQPQPPSQPQPQQNQFQAGNVPTGTLPAEGLVTDPLPTDFGVTPDVGSTGADLNPYATTSTVTENNETPSVPDVAPAAPTQPTVNTAPASPNQDTVPTHNVDVNNNGLLDIESMLDEQLNGN